MQKGSILLLPEGTESVQDEKAFLVDQRSSRKMIIGSIDREKNGSVAEKKSNYTPSEKASTQK